ncbi:MAG: Sec-independent protein translocase protein TatB [Roseinatronobacter sp.]
MFDIGWTELLVIGIVALIVVGPKDLPKMFRTLGQMTAKMRGMAREFQRAMDDAADASGVKDVARDLRKATDPQGMGLDELNKMRNWDPLKDDKPAGASSKTPPSDEDEAAMDQIAAEMDKMRKSRSAAPAPTPAGAPEDASAQAAAPEPESVPAPKTSVDKGQA